MSRVEVGVSTIILRRLTTFPFVEVLLGLRKGNHCPNTWAFPGGKMEYLEFPVETARREIQEETGLSVGYIRAHQDVPYANTIFDNGKHFITLFFVGEYLGGEAVVIEPEKCDRWEWFSPYELPSPLFPGLAQNEKVFQGLLSILNENSDIR